MLLEGYRSLGKMCFHYKAFKASPVGRWTSRSAASIIFLISLLCILPRKLRSLSCRRFKILKNPWIFGEKRDVAAALHSNPTFQLRRHVSARLCLSSEVKDEQYSRTERRHSHREPVSEADHPPPPTPPPASGDITDSALSDRCNMEEELMNNDNSPSLLKRQQ